MKQIELTSKLVVALIALVVFSAMTVPSVVAQTTTSPPIRANSVTSGSIKDGEVKTADLADNAVTSGKIKDGEVSTADIKDGTIQEQDIGTDQVTAVQLAGVSKLIFASCTIHTGSIPPHGGIQDRQNCNVPGASESDKVIASPEFLNGDNIKYDGAVMFDPGIVQIGLSNVGDVAEDPGDVHFNLIVFQN